MKKFVTLLPNNWLAETPETFALRRLGRQSAERSGFLKKTGTIFNAVNPQYFKWFAVILQ
ncbi:hypothetical protein FC678_07785 [Peribacillus simplex]|uniref:Uncharacterized protein n=1 Tax=Peribacillus simplex TaxID=1478 RepID=A0A9X8ZJD6_9BACI|nr:hypothetical protein [Peribacillus simplex]TKH13288.1 hypothetical protein FC678_07785 [Peribacillus simplex]